MCVVGCARCLLSPNDSSLCEHEQCEPATIICIMFVFVAYGDHVSLFTCDEKQV